MTVLQNTFPKEPVESVGEMGGEPVEPVDGLYMINTQEDFKFYHGCRQAPPTVRDTTSVLEIGPASVADNSCQSKKVL